MPKFSARLRELLLDYAHFELFIGLEASVEGHDVRIDSPTAGVATNTDEKKLAVLQWFDGFDQELESAEAES